MSRQGSIPGLLFSMRTEAVLNGDFSVVKDDLFGNSAEEAECSYESVQKALLVLAAVCKDNWCTA